MTQMTLGPALTALAFVALGASSVNAQACGVPPGTIIAYAGEKIPGGWLVADGRPLRQADYPTLYAAIGAAHGGGLNESGVKIGDFNLPDLRGRFLRGLDQSQAGTVSNPPRDPDARNRTAPTGGGNNGNRVGSVQEDATALPRFAFKIGGGEHQHEVPADISARNDWAAPAAVTGIAAHVWISTPAGGAHTHTLGRGRNEQDAPNIAGGGGDAETRPKNVAVYFLICAQ